MNIVISGAPRVTSRFTTSVLAALALAACSESPTEPAGGGMPSVSAAPVGAVGSMPLPVNTEGGTSVPSAAAVLTRREPGPDRAHGRALEQQHERGAGRPPGMPLPGQNNDHSAPAPPAKPASR